MPSRRSPPRIRQSVLTGNIRPLAALKLRLAGLGDHLDLDVGAYGDVHEVRAELVTVARRAARQAYGADFSGSSTVLVGDTPLDVEAALAAGARVVAVATGSYSAADLAGARVVLPDLTDPARVLAARDQAGVCHSELNGATRRARSGVTVPAMQAEHARYLRGGRAGLPPSLYPVVAQRLLSFSSRGIVPGFVLPLVLGRVGQPPVKLHHHAVVGCTQGIAGILGVRPAW